jgi:hypothetical protein
MCSKNSFFLILFFLLILQADKAQIHTINLSGKWDFQIDSLDQGISEKWFNISLTDRINLPGSMLTNNKGDEVTINTKWTGIEDSNFYKSPDFVKYRQPGNVKFPFWLQPLKYYVGVAWYKKKVIIPANWGRRFTELFLERCHWETTLWVDDKKVGMQNALSAPHIYELSKWLTPGMHTISIRIDNRIKDIDPGKAASSITDNTQTNWNGMIGKMILINHPAVYISDVQLYPDVDKKIVKAVVTVSNLTNKEMEYELSLMVFAKYVTNGIKPLTKRIKLNKDTTVIEWEYPMGDRFSLWDEFNPNVYTLNATLKGDLGIDTKATDFGMRKFEIKGTQFVMNGRTIFLRGTLECAIFPKTGYPSVSEKDWERIYRKCREYGLNHIRFHSWCPPEAAFIAADKMGIYLSIENSAWAFLGDGKAIDKYVYEESERIVGNFGNHPSFCLMPYGNESGGDRAGSFLTAFVNYWKAKDNRRFYTSASGYPESPASQYTSSGITRIQWWGAGLKSPINANPPSTDFEWTKYLDKGKPTVSHEIGQWCVYPNFKEMKKYDGVLKPKNFEIFKDKMLEHGIFNLADSFFLASGKLQVLCYKAEIEAQLRTPKLAGFQLLDLHDFPGQGTALVGVLDPFWDEKAYVTAKEYSRFCNSTVPLLQLNKMIYLNNEELVGSVIIAHYGKEPLKNATVSWKIRGQDGKLFAGGKFVTTTIDFGNTTAGEIRRNLSSVSKAQQLTISINVAGYENSWNIWIYPAQQPAIVNEQQIKVTQELDPSTTDYLNKGGTVLLTIKKGSVRKGMGGEVPVGFSSIFWNTQWTVFEQPPFTLGILCNPSHPALEAFPTEYYSNYQWWDAMSHCNAIRLDSVSEQVKPIVRIIDDWITAKPLAMIFECKVGKGKLMVAGVDLITDNDKRPAARQLLYSLKKYMASKNFNPVVEVRAEKIRNLFVK